jgi:hypothetical protein
MIAYPQSYAFLTKATILLPIATDWHKLD